MLGAPAEAAAQSCPAGQRCYYIPPHSPTPTNFSGIGWDLVISSSIGTVNGTYRFGAGAPIAFTAMPGAPTIIALSTTNGVAANYHTVETRGVFIEADNDLFVATRMITGPWQDSASIKESSFALGTRFRAGGYALNALSNPNTGHDMISVYAPTGASVTFTAPEGVVGNFWQGVVGPTHTVSLAAGETFIIRTPGNTCTAEVDGALVTATAPIAVISGGAAGPASVALRVAAVTTASTTSCPPTSGVASSPSPTTPAPTPAERTCVSSLTPMGPWCSSTACSWRRWTRARPTPSSPPASR
ncbi:MAG: hypothetical protein IPN77_13665 [Sandaracinaceae bacterium]|nr:hypothetical protein [Sandaracinaceae bacterium]